MSLKRLTSPAAVALGCAGAALAAPALAPYLATVSLPFFGAVLAGIFKATDFQESFGKTLINTSVGFLTEAGGAAVDKITLSAGHAHDLEKLLATAYLESLEAIEEENVAGRDRELKRQIAEIFPPLKARIKEALKAGDPSSLFPVQTAHQLAAEAYANNLSAEKVSLLIGDEERWHEQLSDEVEIALRRWLNEGRAAEGRAVGRTQFGLATDSRLPDHLRALLRAELPHKIARRVSELIRRDDFEKSWIAFQHAHLQGMLNVVRRVETSQEGVRGDVDALIRRIEAFAGQTELVAAVAEKLGGFLGQTSLPQGRMEQLLERQISALGGLEARLRAEVKKGTREVVGEIVKATEEVKKEIRKGTAIAASKKLKQLPEPPRDFTGREAELAELRRALRQGGVTISGVHGLGGVGKTALALKLAHEFKGSYPDAQIHLDLKGVGPRPLTPAEVMWHVIRSFQPEASRPDDGDLPAWYYSLLNDKRALLLYDNAAGAAQVAPLLPPESCLLLVTSRKHFTLPGMLDKSLGAMDRDDAEELLQKIAPRIGDHAAAIAELCGYLPMALRPAAGALRVNRSLAPEDYLKRLRDRKERLGLRDDVSNLTVEASFGLSYDLLSEELRRRWRMLAIFPADFDAPAAATVWQAEVGEAANSLVALEEYSLLGWAEATRRYSLHDLARDYAGTRLSADEREQAGLLHAVHYIEILLAAGERYLEGKQAAAEGLTLFDNERANIEAGQEWSASRADDNEVAAELSNAYPLGAPILNLRQHPRESIRWHEAGLHAARALDDRPSEGEHLGNLGNAYYLLGEARTALDYHRQSLDISREIGDRRGEGMSLGNMGNAHAALGEEHTAIDCYRQALAIAREIGDRRDEMNALHSLGATYYGSHEPRTAIDHHWQALAIAREIGDRFSEGNILNGLGANYQGLGKVRAALKHYKQALAIAHEVGDKRSIGISLANVGKGYVLLGRINKGRKFMEEALIIFEEVESPYSNNVRQWMKQLDDALLRWMCRLRLLPLLGKLLNRVDAITSRWD